jgi:hypothetical protein
MCFAPGTRFLLHPHAEELIVCVCVYGEWGEGGRIGAQCTTHSS